MDELTLFEAYKRCEAEKRSAREHRGQAWGIAVGEDEAARYWQRRDRQSRKLDELVRRKLGAEPVPTCMRCGGKHGFHYSGCARKI